MRTLLLFALSVVALGTAACAGSTAPDPSGSTGSAVSKGSPPLNGKDVQPTSTAVPCAVRDAFLLAQASDPVSLDDASVPDVVRTKASSLPGSASFSTLDVQGVGRVYVVAATNPASGKENVVFLGEVGQELLRAQGPEGALAFIDLANVRPGAGPELQCSNPPPSSAPSGGSNGDVEPPVEGR